MQRGYLGSDEHHVGNPVVAAGPVGRGSGRHRGGDRARRARDAGSAHAGPCRLAGVAAGRRCRARQASRADGVAGEDVPAGQGLHERDRLGSPVPERRRRRVRDAAAAGAGALPARRLRQCRARAAVGGPVRRSGGPATERGPFAAAAAVLRAARRRHRLHLGPGEAGHLVSQAQVLGRAARSNAEAVRLRRAAGAGRQPAAARNRHTRWRGGVSRDGDASARHGLSGGGPASGRTWHRERRAGPRARRHTPSPAAAPAGSRSADAAATHPAARHAPLGTESQGRHRAVRPRLRARHPG